ncbi:hypothetical protein AB204_02860 [Xenorhabdus khoisanae]|uniref:DUF937 domain-containing protein n=1 Tax=Xenorhabdus khoisanae TaxID=880157 RepID=A0A0J5FXC4_9GAMM|nr:YidB family protein [Xenorhabdus khoisanae]KMJ46592.1 hypothetical protein AB204_02860 [Xenorhabdus khoisanae]
MGFFDQIANMLSGGKNQQLQHVMDWVEGQRGISGLIDKFSQQGLDGTIHSWISSGENKVTPNGEVPENLDLKSAGINLLKNKLLGK